MTTPYQIGLLVFPEMTQLDMTGPLQVFAAAGGAGDRPVQLHLLWKTLDPVPSDSVLTITPTTTFDAAPQLDVICVPGGYGTDALVNDPVVLEFLRQQAEGARYISSVCTGSLVLGAAGLLQGYRAVTHWTAMDVLDQFGAIPTPERVVIDRNRVTGGGVTAGIDFALTLVSELYDTATAQAVQLRMEYNPRPPFDAGSKATAPAAIVDRYQQQIAPLVERRRQAVQQAAARLAS
jgi:cyclohexyl-isocyanide hydratase